MIVKEYLEQVRYLDQRIDSKVEQLTSLKHLATKCTSILTGMPRSGGSGKSSMENVLVKIVDLQEEINRDIDQLIDLKREVGRLIAGVDDLEYRVILEKRYLCYETWEQIALELGYSDKWVRQLHRRALDAINSFTENV